MTNKGFGSGLALIFILVVALLVVFLMMKNMGSFGNRENSPTQKETYVEQAQNAVDQLNQMQQSVAGVE